ncbi:hypothetical protein VKT23_017449 [Stygiomarasmius scandens]|uniref:Chitinase n=1 Tax=Marasmiellus scandens TaxID=2682957 RepID=A0ABR1IRU5_9AGAR
MLPQAAYDYHGPWDTNITDQASVSNPHTSILDIRDSALLYVRAGVDLAKVVSLRPCTFDSQGSLVTFDQQDTWNAKQQFAQKSCFRGTFIWSLNQNTDDLTDDSGSESNGSKPGLFSMVEWNPNPFPSPNARSQTFVQSTGMVTSTVTTVIGASTSTITSTVIVPKATSTTTSWAVISGTPSSSVGTTVVPQSTAIITQTVTAGSTIVSTTIFVNTATTIVVHVPSSTSTVSIGAVIITLNSGGTPVNNPVPTWISQPSAITPNWTMNILPPTDADTVTFTAPLTSTPTWTSIVRTTQSSSTSSGAIVIITGPPGDHSRCNPSINVFSLILGKGISGCMPADVGIIHGITPTPVKPLGWTGTWKDPFPLPTDPSNPGDEDPDDPEEPNPTCGPIPTSVFDSPGDPENADWDELGTDPDFRRRKCSEVTFESLQVRQAFPPQLRHIAVNRCKIQQDSSNFVQLTNGNYVRLPGPPSLQLTVGSVQVPGRPPSGIDFVVQEHIFELGYIDQFFRDLVMSTTPCNWIKDNIFDYIRRDGTKMGVALVSAIDIQKNMVWADRRMNQANSNLVLQNRITAQDPPQWEEIAKIVDFSNSRARIYDREWFIRNLGGLGSYFQGTAGIFKQTALDVQKLLSEITPDSVIIQTDSLPAIFNSWLRALISTYPAGCTSRANNAYAFYRRQIELVATFQNPQNPQVTSCFPLYTANNFNPTSFNAADLIPPAPTTPRCNVPGTTGKLVYVGSDSVEHDVTGLSTQRVMGSGDTNFYALGSGDSIRGSHWIALDAQQAHQTINSNCDGVFVLSDAVPATSKIPSANIDLTCNNGLVGRGTSDFDFYVNGQRMGCVLLLDTHPGGSEQEILCAPQQGKALSCAQVFFQNSGLVTVSGFAIKLRFVPS